MSEPQLPKCEWCDDTTITGICHITDQQYCAKHRNHMHSHYDLEKWVVLSRSRVSPLRAKMNAAKHTPEGNEGYCICGEFKDPACSNPNHPKEAHTHDQ